MNPLGRWDRALTEYEFNHLRPEEKGLRAVTSLTRKIIYLEDMAAGRLSFDPSNIPMKSRPKLRVYEDASKGMWKWSLPSVDRVDGNNQQLMCRYLAALTSLNDMFSSVEPPLEVGEPSQDIVQLKNIISSLRRQNRDFLERIDRLERLLAAKQWKP